jgi:beta-glucosidase
MRVFRSAFAVFLISFFLTSSLSAQLPSTSLGKRPSASLGARPSASLGARPSVPLGARPSASLGARPSVPLGARPSASLGSRVDDLLARMTLEEKISRMRNHSPAIPRLGIPEYDWWNECLHGVARNGVATVFPQAIGLAATWDRELIRRIADAISTEARAKHHEDARNNKRGAYQGLTFWSPNINIFRDPRWGRGQETYGEDPFLTARIGVAFVRGLQGDDAKYLKTIATAKHFAVHSGPEATRHSFDARISKRDLYETYLPAFEALIREGGAWSVMGAYNRLAGVPCCANDFLLRKTLRDDWGFRGYVVTDCGAIWDMYTGHRTSANAAEASVLAVKAGADLTCGSEYDSLAQAVQQGLITEKEIDVSVRRLLEAQFRLGMFDPPELVPYAAIPFSENDSPEHDALARKAAQASIVLLKNAGNTLPLKKDISTVAVIGPYADNIDVLLGNYNGTPSHPVTLLQGIRNKMSDRSRVLYARGMDAPESGRPVSQASIDSAVAIAKQAEVVITVLGISPMLEGEELNVRIPGFKSGDRTTLNLPAGEEQLLRALHATGKPVVLVLTGGSALAVDWENANIPAIVDAWYPGQQGGNAVADVLFGDHNPSGRLPVTFYSALNDLPPFEQYGMAGRTYRYLGSKPLYPFGHGLSYTIFRYDGLEIGGYRIPASDTIHVSFRVTNTGRFDGDEVSQLYVRSLDPTPGSPAKSLKGFRRTFIKKGGQETVRIAVPVRELRVYDDEAAGCVVRPGRYEIQIGASSEDIRLTGNVEVY